jgi:hypothetical protein
MDMIPPIWPWARRAIQTKTSTTTPIRINVGSRLMNHELPGELKDRPPLSPRYFWSIDTSVVSTTTPPTGPWVW